MALFEKAVRALIKENNSESSNNKSKSDVKFAKLELKKARMDQKNAQDQQKKAEIIDNRNEIAVVINYVKNNVDDFEEIVTTLAEETKELITVYEEADKKTKRKMYYKIDDNQQYLYLCKSFFSLLSKAAAGLHLKNNQNIFLIKFLPFFDGVKVLTAYDEDDMEDSSLLGDLADIGKDLASMFVSIKKEKSFSFYDFMDEYDEREDELAIPDVSKSIQSFKKNCIMQTNTLNNENEVSNAIADSDQRRVCPNCNAQVNETQKFCNECGTLISPQKLFCGECGNKVEAGTKFCPYCGSKMG